MENIKNLREEAVHGDINFPINVYFDMTTNNEQLLFCHWHDEIEFIYLNKGRATFYLGSKPINLKEGEALFINSETVHSGYSKKFLDCSFTAIVFNLDMLKNNKLGNCDTEYLKPILNKIIDPPVLFNDKTIFGKQVLFHLKCILDLFPKKEPGYELAINASLLMIIYNIISSRKIYFGKSTNGVMDSYKIEQFKKIIKYIKKNYSNKITLSDLGKEVNISVYHFCRFFKTMSGKTPFEYLVEYRIYRAERLLISTDKKIVDIAMEVGFTSISYFIKRFKKINNCSPSKYRKTKN